MKESSGQDTLASLTKEQGQLVRKNLGLVVVHLRRVPNLKSHTPRRDREWEDLYQEGCIGLMRAARLYREDRGIPFAAFALPRIHNAVSRALYNKFSTVHVPAPSSPRRRRSEDPSEGPRGTGSKRKDADPNVSRKRPRVHSFSEHAERNLPAPTRHDPDTGRCETVGDRLRGKYERAIRRAGRRIAATTSTRGDRAELVHILTEERFLVPHEESRRALRQVARDTHSSYARVAQCDRQIGDGARDILQADPEFGALRRCSLKMPEGMATTIDESFDAELAAVSTEAFIKRLSSGSASEKARLVFALIQASIDNMERWARERVEQLSPDAREALLASGAAPGKGVEAARAASHLNLRVGVPHSFRRKGWGTDS